MDAPTNHSNEHMTERIFRFGNEVVYICLLSVVWLIASLPLITVGAATIGVYTSMLSHLKDGNKQYIRPFWNGFTSGLRRAALRTFFLVLLVGLTGFNAYYYLVTRGSPTGIVLCVVQALLCVAGVILVTHDVAGLASHFAADLSGTLPTFRDACHKAISSPLKSVLIAAVTLGVPAIFIVTNLWQFAIFGIGVICYSNTRILLWKGYDS